jgi:Fe-S-cluster containining protein
MHDAQETPYRAMDDIGVRVPRSMPQPVAPALKEAVDRLAGATRATGIVAAAQQVARDPASKLPAVLALLKILGFGHAQETIDEVIAEAPKIGCGAGCAHCCYQNVEATIPEAILVAAHLADPSDPRRDAVLTAAAARRRMSDKQRRRAGRACPLLIDNRCSVYEDRPLMCRAMLAVDGDQCGAALASILAGGEEKQIEQFTTVQYYVLGDQAGIRGICKDMGLQYDLVELTDAVAAILRDPTLPERWIAGERAFVPSAILDV